MSGKWRQYSQETDGINGGYLKGAAAQDSVPLKQREKKQWVVSIRVFYD